MVATQAARFLARGPLRAELLCFAWETFSVLLFVSAILPAALETPWPGVFFFATMAVSAFVLDRVVRAGGGGIAWASAARMAVWPAGTLLLPTGVDPRAIVASFAFGVMAAFMRRAIYRRELGSPLVVGTVDHEAVARELRKRLGESATLAGILGGHVLLLFGVAFLKAESAMLFQGWWQLVPALALGGTLVFFTALELLTRTIRAAIVAGPDGDPATRARAITELSQLPMRLSMVNFGLWIACTAAGVFYFRPGPRSWQSGDAVLQIGYAALFSWGVAFYQRAWDRGTVTSVERLLSRWSGQDDAVAPASQDADGSRTALRERLLRDFGWPLLFTAALLLLSSIGLYRSLGGLAWLGDGPASLLALFAAFAMLALAVGGVIARVAREISRPIVQVTEAAEAVSRGELARPVPRLAGPTEIERLAESVERMRQHLARTIDELEHERSSLEQRVEERTRELKAALRDLQEAQAALVQGERLASIGELVAGVAHEIYNPINAVAGSAEPLGQNVDDVRAMLRAYREAEAALPEAKRAELEQLRRELDLEASLDDLEGITRLVRRATERTVRIIQSLKNFARVGGELTPSDLEAGLEETISLLGARIRQGGIALERSYGGLPPVTCRAAEIHQVFMNLLVNAVQALESLADDGAPKGLRVATVRRGAFVEIAVEDDGPGVPPELSSRIFDPFFTTKPVGQGTGLGLSISTEIVRRHGGALVLERPSAGRTRFVVRLPIDGAPAASGRRSSAPSLHAPR
jgi:signal transduction histidine kinase